MESRAGDDVNESRLPHPPARKFTILYEWITTELGRDASVVAGHLDYLDRQYDVPGRVLTSRSALIASLQNTMGKDAVLKGVQTLVDAGLVEQLEVRKRGRPKPHHVYRLGPATDGWTTAEESSTPQSAPGSESESELAKPNLGDDSVESKVENPLITYDKRRADIKKLPLDAGEGGGICKPIVLGGKEAAPPDLDAAQLWEHESKFGMEDAKVSEYLASLAIDQPTLSRIEAAMQTAKPSQKLRFVEVCRSRLQSARSTNGYLVHMANLAGQNVISSENPESSIDARNVYMSEDEIERFINGKKTIKSPAGVVIAEIRFDWLYSGKGRFAIADATSVLSKVRQGELLIE